MRRADHHLFSAPSRGIVAIPARDDPGDTRFLASSIFVGGNGLRDHRPARLLAFRLAERAEAEKEALLRNILPDQIVDRLRQHPEEAIAEAFDEASILFSDIQGFVSLSKRLGAKRTVAMLNEMMRRFDALAVRYGVEEIKTIGDAYMAVVGLPQPVPDHAARLARMALEMLKEKDTVANRFGIAIRMRIGIGSGPVMAGMVGTELFSYDVWGDAVNLASRLESTGERSGAVSPKPASRWPRRDCGCRGEIEIKGLGPTQTGAFCPARRACQRIIVLDRSVGGPPSSGCHFEN